MNNNSCCWRLKEITRWPSRVFGRQGANVGQERRKTIGRLDVVNQWNTFTTTASFVQVATLKNQEPVKNTR